MIRKSFAITNNEGELIRGDIRAAETTRDAPVIVMCHGFKGFKDWGFFPDSAEKICHDGYVVVTFNFSRNGIGANPLIFTELESFSHNSYSHELADLKCVIDGISSRKIGGNLVDPEHIGLVGHSRGGGIALLYAARDERISSLVTWSAISTIDRYSEETLANWKDTGYIEVENSRTKQVMQLGSELLTDVTKNRKKLNIESAVKKLDIPILVIHGADDESVPVDEARSIFEWLDSTEKSLQIIDEAGHTFNIIHPMKQSTAEFDAVLDLTINWFDHHLQF